MPAPVALMPAQEVPNLTLPLVGGGDWSLKDEGSENFTLVIFYRGYHCPKCKEQLLDVQEQLAGFAEVGTTAIAISMDGQDRAEKAKAEWELPNLRFAYDLTAEQAREWGLWLSSSRGLTSIGVMESDIFNEPGLFLVRSDGTLFCAWVQSVPFGRPHTDEVTAAINFVLDKDYPPRGTIEDL